VLEEDAFMGIEKFPRHFVVLEDLGVTVGMERSSINGTAAC
jgi:hypothetical protein